MRAPSYRISVDVGGTFTDLVALNKESGELTNIKIPSTPSKPVEGILAVLSEFLSVEKSSAIEAVMHATTIATNALLGQLGLELPRIALITTKGFADVIEIARQQRPELYNLFFRRPRPLVPRRYRHEVEERTGSLGEDLEPLSREDMERAIEGIRSNKIDSVAIGFLNSYSNPKHEGEAKDMIERACSGIFVSTSCEVSPEYREYERISTTVVNAALMPIMSSYLEQLIESLRRLGIEAPLRMMQSSGGVASPEVVAERPVSVAESGPAAGVVASAFYGQELGLEDVISFDMGGTSAKAGSIRAGALELTSEYEVGGRIHRGRLVKGSGYPIRSPIIDLAECSAGGGTMAWADPGGALRVGPTSAGADPGPACYGRGGKSPTITDANLILGRLNPNYLLGGRMTIYPALAMGAFREISSKIGLDPVEAAAGVIRIANSDMSKILRVVSVERGLDPRAFALMAFGGAGPMHACALAEELGISKIVVPVSPGMFSAWGLLAADFKHEISRAVMRRVADVEVEEVEGLFAELEEKGERILREEGVIAGSAVFIRELDARYVGQSFELRVPASRPLTVGGLETVVKSFHKRHREIYGYSAESEDVEAVNARLTALGKVEKPKLRERPLAGREPPEGASLGMRKVFFEERGDYVGCLIYRREELDPGNAVPGPAIIEQYDATTVIYPGWESRVDGYGNLVVQRTGG